MEHPRKVEFAGELERRESVALDAEFRQRFVVGPAAHQIGQDGGARVVFPERGHHLVDDFTLERQLESDVVVDDLDVDVGADELTDARQHVVLLAGERSKIDEGLGAIGDHVVLVAGRQHRRVAGDADGGTEEACGGAGRFDERFRVRFWSAEDGAQPVEQVGGGGGQAQRPLLLADGGHRDGKFHKRVVADHTRTMGGGPVCDQPDPDQRLLPRLQQVRTLAAEVDGVSAHLADRLARARKELGMLVDHEM